MIATSRQSTAAAEKSCEIFEHSRSKTTEAELSFCTRRLFGTANRLAAIEKTTGLLNFVNIVAYLCRLYTRATVFTQQLVRFALPVFCSLALRTDSDANGNALLTKHDLFYNRFPAVSL